MSTDDDGATRSVIRRLEHAVNTRQPDLLDDVVTDDVVRHWPTSPGTTGERTPASPR